MGLEAIILAAAGTAVSAYGSYQEGKNMQKMAKYNAKVDAANQKATAQQANYELDRIREKHRRLRGSQVAATAASGRSMSTMGAIFRESISKEDQEAMQTLYRSKNQIIGLEAQRRATLAAGKNARAQGVMGAVGSLLSGAGEIYSQFPKINKTDG